MINFTFLQALESCPAAKSAKEDSTTLPLMHSEAILVPEDLVTGVYPKVLLSKGTGALKLYQSFLDKGSIYFFFNPFFPLVSLLFFP